MKSKLFPIVFSLIVSAILFSFIGCPTHAAAQQSPCQKVDSDTGKCLDKALKPSEPYPGPDKTALVMDTPFVDKATAEVLQRPLQVLVHGVFGRDARVVGSRAELPPDQKAPVHRLEVTVGYQFGERDQTDNEWKAAGRVILEPVVRDAERQLPGSLGQAADIFFRAGVRSSDLDGRNFTGDHEFVVDVKLDGKGLERRLLYIRVKSSTGLFRNKTCHKITGYGEAINAVKNGIDGLPKDLGCGYRAFELGILGYAAERAFETSWVTPWLIQLKKADAEAADMANCLRRESDGAGGWVCVERKKTFSANDCRVQVKDPAIPGGWRCVAEEATPPVTVTAPPAPAAPDPKGKDPWEGCAPERRRIEGGTGVHFCAPPPTPRDGVPSHPAASAPAPAAPAPAAKSAFAGFVESTDFSEGSAATSRLLGFLCRGGGKAFLPQQWSPKWVVRLGPNATAALASLQAGLIKSGQAARFGITKPTGQVDAAMVKYLQELWLAKPQLFPTMEELLASSPTPCIVRAKK